MKEESKKFEITIEGYTFQSDEEGFLDLNDIWRGCKLPTTRRPSQWRGKKKNELIRCANLHTIENQSLTIKESTTVADEFGTIAYAEWVSIPFWKMVIEAFIALRKKDLEKALELAAASKSPTALQEHKDLMWEVINGQALLGQEQALKCAGIKHPRLFMQYLKDSPKFYASVFDREIIRDMQCSKHKDVHFIKFTRDGFQWLLDGKDVLNDWVEVQKQIRKQRKVIPA